MAGNAQVTVNGGQTVAVKQIEVTVDSKGRRLAKFPNGTTVELQDIPPLIVERLYNDTSGKPKPPMQEVKYGKRGSGIEPNPNDPYFLSELAEWEGNRKIKLMRGLVSLGIKGQPPEDKSAYWLEMFPDASPSELKYLWIAGLCTNTELTEQFIELITGQTVATEGDITASGDSFRGNGQRA